MKWIAAYKIIILYEKMKNFHLWPKSKITSFHGLARDPSFCLVNKKLRKIKKFHHFFDFSSCFWPIPALQWPAWPSQPSQGSLCYFCWYWGWFWYPQNEFQGTVRPIIGLYMTIVFFYFSPISFMFLANCCLLMANLTFLVISGILLLFLVVLGIILIPMENVSSP